jgi:phytoene synthase
MTDAIQRCRASIAHHGKSFALASRLLPAACRDDVAVIYAWCRRVDDAIDLSPGETQHLALARLRRELDAVYGGGGLAEDGAEDVPRALREVVERCNVPREYPEELLAGMEMDVRGHRYQCFDDVSLYGYRVASTVGLMLCHVMGVEDARALRHAAHLGLAMQVTNICRDVYEDWQRGRLYLPDDLLEHHGAPRLRAELGGAFPAHARDACRGVVAELLARADRFYASGDAGLAYLPPRCAMAVDLARRVYSDIGVVLASGGHDVLAPRAVVPAHRKGAACAAALLAAAGRWLRQGRRPLSKTASLPRLPHGSELFAP